MAAHARIVTECDGLAKPLDFGAKTVYSTCMKNNEAMTLNDYQRQAIIDEIRETFVHFNGGQPANKFIENMWQTMSPQNLYKALGNFTRMAENEE